MQRHYCYLEYWTKQVYMTPEGIDYSNL